jgi:hypothetical protein
MVVSLAAGGRWLFGGIILSQSARGGLDVADWALILRRFEGSFVVAGEPGEELVQKKEVFLAFRIDGSLIADEKLGDLRSGPTRSSSSDLV